MSSKELESYFMSHTEFGLSSEQLKNELPEDILLRWFNYYVHKGDPKYPKLTNFSSDIQDSAAYCLLLNQLRPDKCDRSLLAERDITTRARMVIQNAEKINCKRFVTARDIVKGISKPNVMFVAYLFDVFVLQKLKTSKVSNNNSLPLAISDEGSREERGKKEKKNICYIYMPENKIFFFAILVFRLWINSLHIPVRNIVEDLRDGIALIRVKPKKNHF